MAAGIAFGEIPSRGIIVYARMPDGTYQALTTNDSGGLLSGGSSGLTQMGYQQITSLSTSTALTVPNGATRVLIVAESQAVRWRPDGATTAPTATVGMPLAVGQPLVYSGDLSAIRFIEQAASAKLNVFYIK